MVIHILWIAGSMKQLEQDSDNTVGKLFVKPLILAGILVAMVISFSCKNDMEYVKMLAEESDMPAQTARDFDVEFTDSGRLEAVFSASLVERYANNPDEGEYWEFKEGLLIKFYNKAGIVESTLTAAYGKYWIDDNLGYVRDSVVGKNHLKGDELNTEELYWNREKEILYSNVFTKLSNEEGVFYGEEGFESDQDFQNYKLIGSRGTVNVKDEEFPK